MIESMRVLDTARLELEASLKRLDAPSWLWMWRYFQCQLGRHTFQGNFYPYCERCGITKVRFSKLQFFWCCGWSILNSGLYLFVGRHWWSLAAALFTLVLAWMARPGYFRFDRR